MSNFGYARVSTADQDLAAQRDSLTAAGCERIFAEKMSGASWDSRPELKDMLAGLQPGDMVTVTAIDRLARSSRDLHNLLHEIGTRGAQFKSLREAWADTSTPQGRLFISILGALAEMERELIKARTDEGRKRAKAEGRKIGGPYPKLNDFQRVQGLERLRAGESAPSIAKDYGCSASLILNLRKPRKAA